jgi:hypothetical protein
MVTLFLVLLCLSAIAGILFFGSSSRYRRYRRRYEHLGLAICDPGSWFVRFRLRTLFLSGRIGGHRVCYGVLGDERKDEAVSSYLLVEYPVKRNFRFYEGSDPELADREIRDPLRGLQQGLPDFKGLLVASENTPFLARLIARPLGFGYKPGLLLWKWGTCVFDPALVRKDFDRLLRLAEEGI